MTDVDAFTVDEDVHERVAHALLPFVARTKLGDATDVVVRAYRAGLQVEDLVPDVTAFERLRDVAAAMGRGLARALPADVYERVDMGALEQDLVEAALRVVWDSDGDGQESVPILLVCPETASAVGREAGNAPGASGAAAREAP